VRRFHPVLLILLLARLAAGEAAWAFMVAALNHGPHQVQLQASGERLNLVLHHEVCDDHDHGHASGIGAPAGRQSACLPLGLDRPSASHHADHVVRLSTERFSTTATKRVQPNVTWMGFLPACTAMSVRTASTVSSSSSGPAPPPPSRSTILQI
jgi:hypothetical protein